MAVSSLERVSLEHQSLQNEPVVHVVDDDPHLLKSLRWLLESVGHKVATYESAQDFLADLDPAQPGCMLLDVRMPGMSGLELTQLLQSRNIALPVILFTGHGDVPMAVQAMKDGAFDFIEKPYNEQKLLDISCPLFDLVHSDCDGGGIGSPGTLQVPKGSGMDLATPNEDIRTTLLVDDDASVLDLVRLHLRKAGIHADIAGGPHDALEKLATGRYRVVVSDIDMPEMSGVELAKRIRELDPLIQVIMLTTGNAFEKLISSRVAGATDLLSKVHDLACIPAAVSEALERSRRWARLEYTEAEPTPHAPADATV